MIAALNFESTNQGKALTIESSKWNDIWVSYRRDANLMKLFKEVWQKSDKTSRRIVVLSGTLFLSAIGWYFYSEQGNYSIVGLIVSEIILLYFLDQMKSGAVGQSYLFAGDSLHRSSRFSLFKKNISEKKISASDLRKYLQLLDSEIELAATGSGNGRRVAAFGVPLLVGLVVGIATQINDIRVLLLAFFFSLGGFIIAYFIAAVIRTQEEALRELKFLSTSI
ncbi:hypothetical protein [Ectothiorhodospira shaposhnikovii]|uniref:hypothetical protein n=1 Tax=Ectothiorhodospira shaposhnikovii TaxID=1054 RepID=UPI0019050D09|nr:hypothetical protein [Ectothiorhodospira shaposhnikovii]